MPCMTESECEKKGGKKERLGREGDSGVWMTGYFPNEANDQLLALLAYR